MNLLCPNCQKMLSIGEEFAGQTMKCPMCEATFPVPGLPGASPPPSTALDTDIYSLRHDPAPPAPPQSPPHLEPPSSSFTLDEPPPPTKPSLPPEDYQHTLAVSFNPAVLPWIAPLCLVLVFILQLFDWDGIYPGGVPAVTAGAWGAAFGKWYPPDGDLKALVPFLNDEKYKPGASVLTIFYLFLFFPVLIVTIASVIVPMLSLKLPPQVEKLLPWRWGIVAAANFVLFLFLGLQVLLGFSLDSRYEEWVESATKQETKDNPTTQERKLADVKRGELLEMLRHTNALRLVVLLHLLAIVSAVLMFWVNQRGTHRRLPKLELRW